MDYEKMYNEVCGKYIPRIRELEEENKKLKSDIENMKKVDRENIETLDKMSAELENYSKSFKRYRDFSKQELADSLYDSEEQNKKLKSDLGTVIDERDNAFKKIEQLEERLDNKEKVNNSLREELGKITVHSNMLESENRLLKEECKARLEKIKELEK